MKTHLAFLLSTCAGLMTLGAAQAAPAAPQTIAAPQSYAELLAPVQNATDVVIADDFARATQPRPLLNSSSGITTTIITIIITASFRDSA